MLQDKKHHNAWNAKKSLEVKPVRKKIEKRALIVRSCKKITRDANNQKYTWVDKVDGTS